MRFYYISIFSVVLLGLIYLIGTGVLTWFGLWLRKRWKRAWMLMVPLFLLLYAGPVAEEFWIAWNFGRLCKKDAGLFIYKTVEADGFYDDTTHWWRQLAESSYQFVESRDNTYGGLWRVEHDGKEVRHFKIDHPTARYHYIWPDFNTKVGHKLYKQSEAVIDIETREVLGGSNRYGRKSPWFYVALDDPGMSCPRAGEDPLKQPGLVYRRILNARKKGPEGE